MPLQSRKLNSPPWLFHADSQPIEKEPPSLDGLRLEPMATMAKHDDVVRIERRSAISQLFDMIKVEAQHRLAMIVVSILTNLPKLSDEDRPQFTPFRMLVNPAIQILSRSVGCVGELGSFEEAFDANSENKLTRPVVRFAAATKYCVAASSAANLVRA